MSSHREAPGISKDPVADSADLYAFRSYDADDSVTIIANYVPLQLPNGGPNFYEFGDDVLYEIHIDNDGDGEANITYQFTFETVMTDPNTFLYNTGQITSLDDSTWNRRQYYNVTRNDSTGTTTLATKLPCPPCNVGVRSLPDYPKVGAEAIRELSRGRKVFAGQRRDGFYVDLGSIFDLGVLRPFQDLSLIPMPAAPGKNPLNVLNVHSIALQLPITDLTMNGVMPSGVDSSDATIGIWTTASRQQGTIIGDTPAAAGPFTQVSRLGNPLINEVIIPMGQKDMWNASEPVDDKQFADSYAHPELAALLPVLYPNVFPNLAKLTAARADLEAILLTGIPSGIVPGFQNYTGSTQADMLRLNVAIPPTASDKVSILGLIGGDAAGFPNGRRVFDDVVTIELRAVAGVTYPLVDKSYKPDAAAGEIYDIENPDKFSVGDLRQIGEYYEWTFPYLWHPHDGFTALSTSDS